MTAWTHYWTRVPIEGARWELAAGGSVDVGHTAGNRFAARGVTGGDTIYIINWYEDELLLLGRFIVDRHGVVGQNEADSYFGHPVWPAREHLIAKKGSATPYNETVVPLGVVDKIRFWSPTSGEMPVKRTRTGTVERQTFRAVREITGATARLFDSILGC